MHLLDKGRWLERVESCCRFAQTLILVVKMARGVPSRRLFNTAFMRGPVVMLPILGRHRVLRVWAHMMISRGLSVPVILRTADRTFGESGSSGWIRSLKVTELSRLWVTVSSPEMKGRMASGLPEKMTPGVGSLPRRGIVVFVGKRRVVHATWYKFMMHYAVNPDSTCW